MPLSLTRLGLWRLCVPHLTQASFLQKNQTLQNVFFYICNAEIAVLLKIGRHFSIRSNLKLKLSKNVSYQKCGPKLILFYEFFLEIFGRFLT